MRRSKSGGRRRCMRAAPASLRRRETSGRWTRPPSSRSATKRARTRATPPWSRDGAVVELRRGRLTMVGPTTASALADPLALDEADADAALLALESEGAILRGRFTESRLEWCDRRLLARIHRYTLNRLRAEIEPVSPAAFMRFLFVWQHVEASARLAGIDGVRAIIGVLDGF